MYDRPAVVAVFYGADTGLPVVYPQKPRTKGNAVHRRAQRRLYGGSDSPRLFGRRHRENHGDLSQLAQKIARISGYQRLLQIGGFGGNRRERLRSDARTLCRNRGTSRRRRTVRRQNDALDRRTVKPVRAIRRFAIGYSGQAGKHRLESVTYCPLSRRLMNKSNLVKTGR